MENDLFKLATERMTLVDKVNKQLELLAKTLSIMDIQGYTFLPEIESHGVRIKVNLKNSTGTKVTIEWLETDKHCLDF